MEMSCYFHTLAALIPEKLPGTCIVGGWVGTEASLECLEKRKISYSCLKKKEII